MAPRYPPIAVLLLSLALATAAIADPHHDDDAARIRLAVAHGKLVPLPRILAAAQQRVPGEVLKVELEEIGDRLGYEMKVLTPDGRVREIELDARTGVIIKVQDD